LYKFSFIIIFKNDTLLSRVTHLVMVFFGKYNHRPFVEPHSCSLHGQRKAILKQIRHYAFITVIFPYLIIFSNLIGLFGYPDQHTILSLKIKISVIKRKIV